MSFVIGLVIGFVIGVAIVIAYAWLTGKRGLHRGQPKRIAPPVETPARLYRSRPHPNMDGQPSTIRRALFRQKRNRDD